MIRSARLLPLLVAALLGCAPAERPQAPAERAPVFVISIDTLRSDRLPAYGYAGGSTPALDTFRRDAILVRHAFANVPVTLPSHATIFTGRLPGRHGVRDNIGYTFPATERTLATVLREEGWRTGAAVSSFVLRRETGIGAGFDFFDDATTVAPAETISSWQRDGDSARRALLTWLDQGGAAPPFGFLHLYEPHFPYAAPEPFASRFDDPYDGEVAQSDAIVGRFLDDLRQRGLYDRALIVLLSDHGEGLGDHGELEHGVFLYREALQVPLLIKLPGNRRAGETLEAPVSLADVFPTILAALGVERGATPLDGDDALAGSLPERSLHAETYYPRLHYGWSELFSEIEGARHFIEAPAVELYDWRADPAETVNLAAGERRTVAAFRDRVRRRLAEAPFEEPRPTDPETVAKLESLGYLGGGPSASGPRPDPKTKIEVLAQFGTGAAHMQRGEYAKAIEIGRAIVARDPGFLQGWGLIGSAAREMGDVARAVEAFEEQMARSPGNPQTALALSNLYFRTRDFDRARSYAELARPSTPSLAWESIASIELARGRLDEADAAARHASESGPLRVQPLLIRSQVRHARQDAAGELALLDEARRRVAAGQAAPVPELEMRRGDALLRLRRAPEAEAAFRAETERFPRNVQAWLKLALVVGAQGRREESRSILARVLETDPSPRARGAVREALTIMGDTEGIARLGVGGSGR